MDTVKLGKWGEQKALEYLNEKNYTIVSKGFRSRFGEIDLIVRDKSFLVFVEVKTRKNANFAHAREYVSRAKQKKIISTAGYYLAKRPTRLQPRFDVIEIYTQPEAGAQEPEIIHIENAFGVN